MTDSLRIVLLVLVGCLLVVVTAATLHADVDRDMLAAKSDAPNPDSLRLPTFIDSHMVLQREPLSSRIWGWTKPGLNVTITIKEEEEEGDTSSSTIPSGPPIIGFAIAASSDSITPGSWQINLPPQPAGGAYTLTISDGIDTIKLVDIAFGDVYLCSGQSNMQMAVRGTFNASEEIKDSISYPDLRLATVQLVTSDTPEDDVPHKGDYTWGRSSAETVGGKDDFDVFSATCYYFGRELYKSMDGKVPIGLLVSCWGGQRVEAFSSPEALNDKRCGGTRPYFSEELEHQLEGFLLESHRDRVEEFQGNLFDGDGPKDTQLWNAMIHPLLPMRFTGALWYQGEANAGDPASYACRFPAMITDWRRRFELPQLTFLYVELAGYHPGETWPEMRAAQGAARQLPKVGYATAIDLGDPSSPDGSIHPRRKQEIGRRLALEARSIHYHERDGLVVSGPSLSGVQFVGSMDGTTSLVLSFASGTADTLHSHATPECNACCSLPPFHVLSDSTGEWARVNDFTIDTVNGEIVLSTDQLADIVGVRYAWEAYPECVIYNGQGGPDDHLGFSASPFEWCAFPSGKPPWSGQACKTQTPTSLSRLSK